MRALKQDVFVACLYICAFIFFYPLKVYAEVPAVEIETDPLTSRHCSTHAPNSLTISGMTTSASTISDNGASIYQTAFNSQTWSGSLKKYRLSFDPVKGVIRAVSTAEWDAADILTGVIPAAANPSPQARRIYTSTITEDKSSRTIPFLSAALPPALKAFLNTSPAHGSADQLGEERLDYLRGLREYELVRPRSTFRARDRILGAIAHSVPVFVGPPSAGLQGRDYQTFYDENKGRRSAVYIGAGDGMLHAFDAVNGVELFAYVPQALFKNLSSLTHAGGIYRPFVDGAITVAEARVGHQWKTILVSGLGGGGQGVFALDVTNPDQFDRGLGALWEFTDADDADMGNVVGAPLVAKFKVKVNKGIASYRDFAVVAGGLNSYRADGTGKFNAQAPGALFLLALDKAKSEPWKIGFNYFKFLTPISDKALANGLHTPSITLSDDGAVKSIYSGDLQGNLWRFDFNGDAPWENARDSASTKRLFAAIDQHGNKQVITQKVQVIHAPNDAYLVLFGTGKLMEAEDMNAAQFMTQSFYGILDAGDGKTVTLSQLKERKLITSNSSSGALEISGSDIKYVIPANGDKGWYFEFLESNKTGERSVSTTLVRDGILFFNTLIPNADPCQPHDGRSYVLNTLTGMPAYAELSAYPVNTSLLSSPAVMTIVPAQVEPDSTGKRRVKKRLEVLEPVTSDKSGSTVIAPRRLTETTTTSGRLSWREIVNWVELRTSEVKN